MNQKLTSLAAAAVLLAALAASSGAAASPTGLEASPHQDQEELAGDEGAGAMGRQTVGMENDFGGPQYAAAGPQALASEHSDSQADDDDSGDDDESAVDFEGGPATAGNRRAFAQALAEGAQPWLESAPQLAAEGDLEGALGADSNIANAKIDMSPQDHATAAGHHHHHGHHVHGWLKMGAETGKKGAFKWHDKHPVGGKGRR